MLIVPDLMNSGTLYFGHAGLFHNLPYVARQEFEESKISRSVSCGRKPGVADRVAVCKDDRDEKSVEFQLLSSSLLHLLSSQSCSSARVVTDLLLGR